MSLSPRLRAQLLSDAEATRRLSLAYVGVTAGLFVALEAGPDTAAGLAARASVDPATTQRWADAAAAFGLLDRDGDRFALTDLGAAFSPDAPGTAMPFALGAVLTAHMADATSAALQSGEIPGERVLDRVETLGPWFGPMLEASFGPMFEAHVLPAVTELAAAGAEGGLVVDLGCGNGWYLRRLLARFPALRGHGLDPNPLAVSAARDAAAQAGLTDRLTFAQGTFDDAAPLAPARLVVMNRALHHVWGAGPEAVAQRLYERVAPGGAVLLWEPRWPDDPSGLGGHPRRRGMAFMGLVEHLQGNHLLRPVEVEAALGAAGFVPHTHLLMDETEMVVVGRRPAD
jgi:SAM-dependent methyltransferase